MELASRALDILAGQTAFLVAKHWVREGKPVDFSPKQLAIVLRSLGFILHVRALMVQMVLLQELLESPVASEFHEFQLPLVPDVHRTRPDERELHSESSVDAGAV